MLVEVETLLDADADEAALAPFVEPLTHSIDLLKDVGDNWEDKRLALCAMLELRFRRSKDRILGRFGRRLFVAEHIAMAN